MTFGHFNPYISFKLPRSHTHSKKENFLHSLKKNIVVTLDLFLFGGACKAVRKCQKTLIDSIFFQSSPFNHQRVCSTTIFQKQKTFVGGND